MAGNRSQLHTVICCASVANPTKDLNVYEETESANELDNSILRSFIASFLLIKSLKGRYCVASLHAQKQFKSPLPPFSSSLLCNL